MKVRIRVGIAAAVLAVGGGAAALATDFGEAGVTYYVEGARPPAGTVAHGDETDDCVPWSSDRTDIRVCGELPDGWQPGSAPGGIEAYPEVCAAALERYHFEDGLAVVSQTREEVEAGDPTVDPQSCYVDSVGSYPGVDRKAPDFTVSFVLEDGSGNVHVMLDTDEES
jgi:hypothetical protein